MNPLYNNKTVPAHCFGYSGTHNCIGPDTHVSVFLLTTYHSQEAMVTHNEHGLFRATRSHNPTHIRTFVWLKRPTSSSCGWRLQYFSPTASKLACEKVLSAGESYNDQTWNRRFNSVVILASPNITVARRNTDVTAIQIMTSIPFCI